LEFAVFFATFFPAEMPGFFLQFDASAIVTLAYDDFE